MEQRHPRDPRLSCAKGGGDAIPKHLAGASDGGSREKDSAIIALLS